MKHRVIRNITVRPPDASRAPRSHVKVVEFSLRASAPRGSYFAKRPGEG